MAAVSIIPLSDDHPYLQLLSYPEQDVVLQQTYKEQLRQLGVEGLVTEGPVQLAGFAVLGVGYCGVVLAGVWQGQSVAIKVKRRDCQQPDLSEEVRLLRRANQLGLGPQLLAAEGDLLVMERLAGVSLAQWLSQSDLTIDKVKYVLRQLLEQGLALDLAGIDHGALRYPSEHALIDDDRLTLIDFSHSSDRRRPNNVTSLVQGVLWGTRLAEAVAVHLPLVDRHDLLPLLRQYKQQPSKERFAELLEMIGWSR